VDQAAQEIMPADTIKVDDIGDRVLVARRPPAERRPLPEGAVRPVLVVGR
jgi:hypothetical protein